MMLCPPWSSFLLYSNWANIQTVSCHILIQAFTGKTAAQVRCGIILPFRHYRWYISCWTICTSIHVIAPYYSYLTFPPESYEIMEANGAKKKKLLLSEEMEAEQSSIILGQSSWLACLQMFYCFTCKNRKVFVDFSILLCNFFL